MAGRLGRTIGGRGGLLERSRLVLFLFCATTHYPARVGAHVAEDQDDHGDKTDAGQGGEGQTDGGAQGRWMILKIVGIVEGADDKNDEACREEKD